MGASSKRGDNTKIGQYGSGNKYSLAYLLRNNYEVTIMAGNFQVFLTTKRKKFRDKEFDIILVDGKETSITTEFGKDWGLGQAIRELYCNAIDEGGHTMEFVKEIVPESDKTSFYIKSREEITSYVSNFDDYFAENIILNIGEHNQKSIIHKLSHQHLHIKFWKINLEGVVKNGVDSITLKTFPFPIVIHNFIEMN